jgi:hypothetical protein
MQVGLTGAQVFDRHADRPGMLVDQRFDPLSETLGLRHGLRKHCKNNE